MLLFYTIKTLVILHGYKITKMRYNINEQKKRGEYISFWQKCQYKSMSLLIVMYNEQGVDLPPYFYTIKIQQYGFPRKRIALNLYREGMC